MAEDESNTYLKTFKLMQHFFLKKKKKKERKKKENHPKVKMQPRSLPYPENTEFTEIHTVNHTFITNGPMLTSSRN